MTDIAANLDRAQARLKANPPLHPNFQLPLPVPGQPVPKVDDAGEEGEGT